MNARGAGARVPVGVAGTGEGLGLAFALGEGSSVSVEVGVGLIAAGWQATNRMVNGKRNKRLRNIVPNDNKVITGGYNKNGSANGLPTHS